ncbi:anthranilate synthase component I [Bifidobacterium vespertilionis]|uniref:Anthranilate synthase component 1 n=1 Tax=Bifidobacterium vespertilionis TaxID=2562524 RepID=A0A5J5E4Q9_9BIFI|nr:anthranilate synthase component I [Bifidobacterium vespertilionis]KAA8822551.1 anthranilate synthase component I [Bifidobacterium vespertilionis]KAA8824164.1 anthranilate synthase component I [Bifidobacterium vespertilionis]
MSECSVEHLAWGGTWPSREQFHELADKGYRVIPIVRRLLADSLTPVGFYERLAGGRTGTFILESAEYGGSWSRYSFIGVNSVAQLRSRDGKADWLGKVPVGVPIEGDVIDVARATLATLKAPDVDGLPTLTSGLVGTVGWDAIRHWEPTLRAEAPDETGQPETVLALATDIAIVDHVDGSVWIIANAVNFDDRPTRADFAYDDAIGRLDRMQKAASTPQPHENRVSVLDPSVAQPELRFRSAKAEYEHAVEEAKRHIVDGDVFQVVISQRLDIDSPADPFDVYRVLRTLNPSPYMYFMALTDAQGRNFNVIGSSPETLIKVDHGHAMTFPIAGSRPRGKTPEEDARLAKELLADPKERSEHIMLVDLSRNDLSRVCDPDTVEVVSLMDIKRFSHIMHICSTVTGHVRDDLSTFDVFTSAFPAGTLSGAPKPRAVEIIDELEPSDRGIYGGTIGYFDFSGNMDMAIAIRTAFIRDHEASVQAGAGIVLDSVPANEWQETRNKAEASVESVQIAAQLRSA